MMGRNARKAGLRRLLQALIVVLLLPTLVVSADAETQLGTTYLLSHGLPNEVGKPYGLGKDGNSLYTSLSWDDTSAAVVFASSASNLNLDGGSDNDGDVFCVNELTNQLRGCFDIFLQFSDTPSNPLIKITNYASSENLDGDAVFPTVSRDGKYIVFQSSAEYSGYDQPGQKEADIFFTFTDKTKRETNGLFRVSATPSGQGDAGFHSGNVECALSGSTPVCSTQPNGTVKAKLSHPHPVADATFISSQGVYVVFESMADLGENSNDYVKDIFIRQVTDVGENLTQEFVHTLLSRGCGGAPANGDSYHPVFVPGTNGRYVVFVSRATNLDCSVPAENYPPDNPNAPLHQRRANIFLLDRDNGSIRLISKNTSGLPANGASEYPAVTYDPGQDKLYVAFQSSTNDLINLSSPRTVTRIYLYQAELNEGNLSNPSIQLISVRPDDKPTEGPSYHPSISEDGRIVSFTSYDDQLVEGDLNNACVIQNLEGWTSNNCPDIFGRNWQADQTWRASLTAGGQPPELNSNFSSLSATGRWVAFSSGADMLSEGEAAAYQQVYLRDQGNPPGNPNIQPSFHDFGVVEYGSKPEKLFNVYFFGLSNIGGSVTVTGVDINLNKCEVANQRDCFEVIENGCNGPRNDNTSCTFKVGYRAPDGEQPLQRGKVRFSFIQDATNLFLEVGLRAATPFYQPDLLEPEAQTVYYNGDPNYREIVVKNKGNVPETFNITLTFDKISLWVTDLQGNPITQVGPLQPNEECTLLLWAKSGDWGQSNEEYVEEGQISLSSVTNTDKSVTQNFKTTSLVKRYQPTVETFNPSEWNLDFNTTAFFTFTVRNDGNIGDTFSVSFANNEFSLWLDPADASKITSLPPGKSADVRVWVRATQPNHADDDIRVIFTSQGDPSKKDERTVRVTSGPAYIYLPLVRK
ncbi:MAG: hypothetical protein KatS3mg051_1871 [Anaerolineae bacterium]|nr:MAG: hypothetical protein KatS3mg051_1871 [Anaerolineae bacterium]